MKYQQFNQSQINQNTKQTLLPKMQYLKEQLDPFSNNNPLQNKISKINYNPNVQCQKLAIYLQRNWQQIKLRLNNLTGGKQYVDFANLWQILGQILTLQNVSIAWKDQNILQSQSYLEIFDQKVKQYVKGQTNQDINLLKIEFNVQDIKSLLFYLVARDCLTVFIQNYQTNQSTPVQNSAHEQIQDQEVRIRNQVSEKIRSQLQNTIKNYQKLLGNKNLLQLQKKVLITTLDKLKQQLQQLQKAKTQRQEHKQNQSHVSQTKQNDLNTIKSCFQLIFQYYCKLTYVTGKDPTFDLIKFQTNILTLTKFMLFCKDFKILSQRFKKSQIMQIFKKNSQFHKQMNLQQFINAINVIAIKIFKSKEDPQKQMYQHLGIQNQNQFKSKLKQLRIPLLFKQKKLNKITNYKFKYIPHGGKFAQQIKLIIQQKKRIKTQQQKQRGAQITKLKLLRAEPININRKKYFSQKQKQVKKSIKNLNYSRIQNRIDKTGYSQLYKKKDLRSRQDIYQKQMNPYKMNDVVQKAREHIKKLNTLQSQQKNINDKIILNSLIQDEEQQQDEYLIQHNKMQQSKENSMNIRVFRKLRELQDGSSRNTDNYYNR